MKRNFVVVLMAAALVAAAFGRVFLLSEDSVITEPFTQILMQPIAASKFVDQAFLASARVKASTLRGRPKIGVVNHHTLASDLIAHFFKSIKTVRPDIKRFIIVSPDHYFSGRGFVSTHDRAYFFGGRTTSVNSEAVDFLIAKNLAVLESGGMFEKEHGIGALVPFLAREFPAAQIVPISIRSTADRDEVARLGNALAALADEETFLIISADMSHYLTEAKALKNDELTLRQLNTNDLQALSEQNDDFTDSGLSFLLLKHLFETLKLEPNFELLDHSISSKYVADKLSTTTYITGVWTLK